MLGQSAHRLGGRFRFPREYGNESGVVSAKLPVTSGRSFLAPWDTPLTVTTGSGNAPRMVTGFIKIVRIRFPPGFEALGDSCAARQRSEKVLETRVQHAGTTKATACPPPLRLGRARSRPGRSRRSSSVAESWLLRRRCWSRRMVLRVMRRRCGTVMLSVWRHGRLRRRFRRRYRGCRWRRHFLAALLESLYGGGYLVGSRGGRRHRSTEYAGPGYRVRGAARADRPQHDARGV
jgi:hypothetical protein